MADGWVFLVTFCPMCDELVDDNYDTQPLVEWPGRRNGETIAINARHLCRSCEYEEFGN
jgi:hypothetical protein